MNCCYPAFLIQFFCKMGITRIVFEKQPHGKIWKWNNNEENVFNDTFISNW